MSEHAATAHGHDGGDHGAGAHVHHPNYVKIWAILLALLVVSVRARSSRSRSSRCSRRSGIAIVKAYLVVKNFMHIDVAGKYVTYFVVTALVFMFLLFAGAAPDVMKPAGRNWTKPSWLEGTAHPAPAEAGHEEHH